MDRRNVLLIGAISFILLATLAGFTLIAWKVLFGGPDGVVISDQTEIGAEWKEIRPSAPLIVEREQQFLAIEVEPPYSAWENLGITLPSGDVVNPEIKIYNTDGIEYDLKYFESTRSGGIFKNVEYAEYVPAKRLSRSIKIERILLRSTMPISVKRIFWSGFDWKDRK